MNFKKKVDQNLK